MRLALFLGPDKAGSSWMFRLAAWHPQIAVPPSKDLFFFDRFYDRGIAWYGSRFALTDQTRVQLEICHDYLFSSQAAGRIRHHYPEARLLVCLRHPVDRAVSAYLYMRRQGRVRQDLSTAIRTVGELVDHGRYGAHLATYLRLFPRAQLHVLDFEALRSDAASFARSFFEAVGVEPREPPGHLLAPARAASRPRSTTMARTGKLIAEALRQHGHEQILARLKGSALIEWALFRRLGVSERVRPTARDVAYLRAQLRDDTDLLDRQLGSRYLERWWDATTSGEGSGGAAAHAPPRRTNSNSTTTRAGAT